MHPVHKRLHIHLDTTPMEEGMAPNQARLGLRVSTTGLHLLPIPIPVPGAGAEGGEAQALHPVPGPPRVHGTA